MYPWQPRHPQQQASHYPPAPPQQAAVGAFYVPWAQVTTGNYAYSFPQPQQQIVCAICQKRINWGEPQCHFPPWNSRDGVESVGGDGNGTDGTILPAVTLHLHCGKSRVFAGPDLHLVAAATIRTRYGKSHPAYRNPTGAVKAAIRRSRRCLLEFNGFETPTLYHLEGELVPLVEEELEKCRTGTKGKKKNAADKGGDVSAASAASVSEEQRKREEEEREIDDEARAVLEAIAAEKEEAIVTEKECATRGTGDCDAIGQATGGKREGGRSDEARPPDSPESRKRKQHRSGEEHPSKKAKQQVEQSKSPKSGTAVGLVRKRQKTSFLCDEQAEDWAKPKVQSKARGVKRLQDKISATYNKYIHTKNALYRETRRNEELQARLETRMKAFPRSQHESLIAYAIAAIDCDRGGEVRRAIERFREDEVQFMKRSMEEVIDSLCDNGVVKENEVKFTDRRRAAAGCETNRDETETTKDPSRKDMEYNEETNRSEKEAKEDTNRSEEAATEDRKAKEDIDHSEKEAKVGTDTTTTVAEDPREDRRILL